MKKTLLTLFSLLLIVASCSSLDPTRCDLSGCDNRKNGHYLLKNPPHMTSHSSYQRDYSRSKHAYRGKEFCSNAHATSWYNKL